MIELPHIKLDDAGMHFNGEPCPYLIAEDITVSYVDGLPRVTVTFFAESIDCKLSSSPPVEERELTPEEQRALRLEAAAFGSATRAPS